MSSAFPSRLRHIQRNDPVSASVASAASVALEARTNYLKEVLDAIEAGRALIQTDAPVDPNTLVGQPVFWDAVDQRYEPALAAVYTDPTTGAIVSAESSYVVGLVLAKKSSDVADIVFWGLVHFTDLSNVVDDTPVEAGRYYLSASSAGGLVRQRPPVTVPVCLILGPLDACDANTWVFVSPQIRDFLEDHIHYQVELVARPAGTHVPPEPGHAHVITDADATLLGWLPADDASFNGNAPDGAVFGYNLAAHTQLSELWPPIPLSGTQLEMRSGSNTDERSPHFLHRVGDNVVRFDTFGIWWMTDCYDQVPWPTNYTTSSSSQSSSSSESATCVEVTSEMQLLLSFTKMTFVTDKTAVTSLQPDTGQPLQFVNRYGEVARTGDLFARVVLPLLLESDEYYGGLVLKGVTDDNKLTSGYVTEGIIAGSDMLQVTSTRQRYLTPGDPNSAIVHQELVTLDISSDPTERELLPQIVVLGDTQERVYENIAYLGFPSGRSSGIRAKFVIPSAGLPSNPVVRIRAVLFGRGDGTLTDLDTSYYRFARPTDGTPTPITAGDTALVMDTAVVVAANNAIEVTSDPFDVEPGDTLFVSVDRDVDGTPVYNYEIGVIRLGAVITGS